MRCGVYTGSVLTVYTGSVHALRYCPLYAVSYSTVRGYKNRVDFIRVTTWGAVYCTGSTNYESCSTKRAKDKT